MPIEPVKIPQNVYVEDRIVGPVTLRQLIILLGTGGFSYAIWTGIKNQLGAASLPITILCWIPFLIGIVFAFVRIQGIGLMRFILLMVEKLEKPSMRQWSPRRGITINFQYFKAEDEKKKQAPVQPHREKLEELSAMLDRGPVATEQNDQDRADTLPEVNTPSRPVDKDHIQAETPESSMSLDDISAPQKQPKPMQTSSDETTLRDILPPSGQHA